jgi:hypothetical protein
MMIELKKIHTQKIIQDVLSKDKTKTVFYLSGQIGEIVLLNLALKFSEDINVAIDNSLKLFKKDFCDNNSYLIKNGINVIEFKENSFWKFNLLNNIKYVIDAKSWEDSTKEIPYYENQKISSYIKVHPLLHWYKMELLIQIDKMNKENSDIFNFYSSSWSKKGKTFSELDRNIKKEGKIKDSERKQVIEQLKDLGYI